MSTTPTPPAPSSPTPCTTEPALWIGGTTLDGRDAAHRLARALVDEKLAACVQVSDTPVVSYYRWKGKTETAPEYVVTVKFTGDKTGALERRLRELHPYETPQWYAVRAGRVSPDYLAWAAGDQV